MVMTVAEFGQWLTTQDQGAILEVLARVEGRGYQGDTFEWRDFNPEEHANYVDMRGNRFAAGTPYAESRTLSLGEA